MASLFSGWRTTVAEDPDVKSPVVDNGKDSHDDYDAGSVASGQELVPGGLTFEQGACLASRDIRSL